MLFQLGDKEFDGIVAPYRWAYRGNEANLAEHALINTKPRLQMTGETLEELELSFKLRADFCNPAQEITDLEQWKSDAEILPLLLGTGEYLKDYLIRSISKSILQTFADGAIIEADISIVLVEYVSGDKERQQAAADRKNAMAVGDKSQVVRNPAQGKTPEADAHNALMTAQIESWEAAEQAQTALQSTNPNGLIDKVNNAVSRAQTAMNDARDKINDVQTNIDNAMNIVTSIQTAAARLQSISAIMQPPISLNNLDYSIINLQAALNDVSTSSNGFTRQVILRKI